MTIFWSPSKQGFYGPPETYPKNAAPDDLVEVTKKHWQAMRAANENGAAIVNGPKDQPVAEYAAEPSVDEKRLRALQRVKREAARRIDAVMPVFKQINALRLDPLSHQNCEAFAQIDAIRSASDIIEQDVMDSEAPEAVPINSHPAWPHESEQK